MSGPGSGATLAQDSSYNLHNDGVYNLHNDTIAVVIDIPNRTVTVTTVANATTNWTTQVQHVSKLPVSSN